MRLADHLLVAPILLPLLAGAAMLLIDERRRELKAAINLAAIAALVGLALALMEAANGTADWAASLVYRLGDWPAPFAIVLVADRLSATMLLLTAVLALATTIYALPRWQNAGAHFHSMVQFLLMGLNGAFLTGDLFNLFVFFELLLAASYGLMLHGSGRARIRAGLHYVVVNLAASLFFLVGVALIYAVTGTLNMADLAARVPHVAAENRMLLEAGAAILGVAFLVKAGIWPLNFWLPTTYAAAAPPVAAMFAIMSKVGLYVVMRLWLLVFGAEAGASAQFGAGVLFAAGLATIVFGSVGALASRDLQRIAGFAVLVSSGTILAVVAIGGVPAIGAAVFYLVSSTLGLAILFMLIELVERVRDPVADMLEITREAYGEDDLEEPEEESEAGIVIPATVAFLGVCYIACVLVVAGLPPLSGFVAKFAMLAALMTTPGTTSAAMWAVLALVIASGLFTLMALMRVGIRTLWVAENRVVPKVRLVELLPILALLFATALLTARAEPAMRYLQAAAADATDVRGYTTRVLGAAKPQAALREGEGR